MTKEQADTIAVLIDQLIIRRIHEIAPESIRVRIAERPEWKSELSDALAALAQK